MNGNDAIIFWYFEKIAFKQVLMDSETIHGSVDTDKTAIAKILNNSMSS